MMTDFQPAFRLLVNISFFKLTIAVTIVFGLSFSLLVSLLISIGLL